MASSSSSISFALLTKQNAETSNALIGHWKSSPLFAGLAKYEGQLTIQRDDEDGIKLQKGIDFAKSKGVIDPDYVPEKYVEIDVLGKTPDSVADEILNTVKSTDGDSKEGSVIVLCGLSGTGKVSCPNSNYGKSRQSVWRTIVLTSNVFLFRVPRYPNCFKNSKQMRGSKS
jgi:hypothetical protein